MNFLEKFHIKRNKKMNIGIKYQEKMNLRTNSGEK